jgi:hypothetical protein
MPMVYVCTLKKKNTHTSEIAYYFQDEGGKLGGRKVLYRLFDTIYEGCPQLDYFNTIDLSVLRQHQLPKKQWSHYALKLCVRQCRKNYEKELGRRQDSHGARYVEKATLIRM